MTAPIRLQDFSGHRIYLDANILIYGIERGHHWRQALRELFGAIDRQSVHALTSELTLAEVLAKPLAVGASDLVDTYEYALRSDGPLTVVPIDRAILRSAAKWRARSELKLVDAIHIATAELRDCKWVLTNDLRLKRAVGSGLRCIDLWEIAGEERPQP